MNSTEIFFLVIVALFALVAYLPRILLWWVKRKVRKHMEEFAEQSDEPQTTGWRKATSSSSRKQPIAEDEGEYVPYEDISE